MPTLVPWIGFIAIVLVMLALDLGVFHRGSHRISVRDSLIWTSVWIVLALLFSIFVYYAYTNHWFGAGVTSGLSGGTAAVQYLTGYVIEKSLSLDNIFVIAIIFSTFGIPDRYQHRVLFWGILGALVLRGVFIAAGAALIHSFEWIIYVFGGFLVFTAIRMLMHRGERQIDPENNRVIRLVRRFLPVTNRLDGEHFFTREGGRRAATPLFLALVLVESSDVLFAVDSVPAIFAVTRDPFLVFTSNVFAILGLRSLYFTLAGALRKFRYLDESLVLVLLFVGVKMLLSNVFHIPAWISLVVILSILGGGMLLSLRGGAREPVEEAPRRADGHG